MKNLEFDKEAGTFTRREEIKIEDAKGVEEIRQALKIELAGIVRQVKGLKRRAEEIKEMLDVLDEKSGPKDPDPERPAQR